MRKSRLFRTNLAIMGEYSGWMYLVVAYHLFVDVKMSDACRLLLHEAFLRIHHVSFFSTPTPRLSDWHVRRGLDLPNDDCLSRTVAFRLAAIPCKTRAHVAEDGISGRRLHTFPCHNPAAASWMEQLHAVLSPLVLLVRSTVQYKREKGLQLRFRLTRH